ncbi:MAG: hypothetical protein ACK5SP_01920 [bacterium]|jgi:hypothetical protein
MKVYIINLVMLPDDINENFIDMANDQFMDIAEQYGEVYSLKGFENAYNHDEFISQSDSYIRFIQ